MITLIVAATAAPMVVTGVALVWLLAPLLRPRPSPAVEMGYRYDWPQWRRTHRARHTRRRPTPTPVQQRPARARLLRLVEEQVVRRRLTADWRTQLAWRPA